MCLTLIFAENPAFNFCSFKNTILLKALIVGGLQASSVNISWAFCIACASDAVNVIILANNIFSII